MKRKPEKQLDASGLRRRAEARLSEKQRSQRFARHSLGEGESEGGDRRRADDTQRSVQELQIHQIELDMQNEKLDQSRAETEAALEQYTKLYDFAPVGYFTLGRDGTIRRVNLTGAVLLGIERSRLVNRRFALFVSDDTRPTFNAFLAKVFEGRLKEAGEVALLKLGSQPLFAHINATVSEGGEECRAVVMDITQRKRAEKALRKSDKKYRLLADNVNDVIFILDLKLHYIYISPSVKYLRGYEPAEVLKQMPAEGMSHSSWDLAMRTLSEVMELEKFEHSEIPISRMLELDMRRKDGSTIWTEVKLSFIKDENQRPMGILGIIRDITERKRAEAEKEKLQARLIQAQKMEAIGTLAGGIAHDFNNILSAIFGYTELALMKIDAETEIKADLKEVLRGAERAKSLVKQILTFSRQAKEEQIPVQMGLIAKEALKLLRSSLPATIDIRQNILSESIVLSDPTQLHQIVMNLCTNAAHAMKENGGILEVTLTDVALDSDFCSTHLEIQPGDYQKLSVGDSGHGMTADVMNRIFDPFFTTKPKDEGTGLGLSVVHGIVKNCGGTITVYSEPDKGTAFNLYFPIVKGTAEEKPEAYRVIPTGTEHILFVDDEKVIVELSKKILISLGYSVKARTSSFEALELFKAMPGKFDLIITDMTMPQMTGDALARELMKIRPDLPVILCTGFSENITREKAETMGIKAFLLKPLLKKEMAHTIRKVLDGGRKDE